METKLYLFCDVNALPHLSLVPPEDADDGGFDYDTRTSCELFTSTVEESDAESSTFCKLLERERGEYEVEELFNSELCYEVILKTYRRNVSAEKSHCSGGDGLSSECGSDNMYTPSSLNMDSFI